MTDDEDSAHEKAAKRAVRWYPATVDGKHHVFVVHPSSPEWWRLVATFQTYQRAEDYADFENMFAVDNQMEIDDGSREPKPDEGRAPPGLPEVPTSAIQIERFRRPTPAEAARVGAALIEDASAAAGQPLRIEAAPVAPAPAPLPEIAPQDVPSGPPTEPEPLEAAPGQAAAAPTCENCGKPRSIGSAKLCDACYHARAAERRAEKAPDPRPALTDLDNAIIAAVATRRCAALPARADSIAKLVDGDPAHISTALARLINRSVLATDKYGVTIPGETFPTPAPQLSPLSHNQQAVLSVLKSLLQTERVTLEQIAKRAGIPYGSVTSAVSDLERKKLIPSGRQWMVRATPVDFRTAPAAPTKAAETEADAEIAAFLAKKGATKPAEITEPFMDDVMNEVRRDGPECVPKDETFRVFVIDGVREPLDRESLVARANRLRIMRGAPVWDYRKVQWKRAPEPEPKASRLVGAARIVKNAEERKRSAAQ